MQKTNQILPQKLSLPFKIKRPVLAVGSQTKNTLCFAKGSVAYLSSLHPDLSNFTDFLKFEKTLKYFLKKQPKIIAYDLHPEYQSTKYVLKLQAISYKLQAIQHHHAHISSCMIENGLLNQKVIGVAFDGTGWGSDETFWGAEFLLCDYKDYQRIAHLKEIPLLGQERAIRQPWRLACAWLYQIYQDRFINLKIDFAKNINRKKWEVIKKMYLAGFNSPLTSSMGRLFDAVASIVLLKSKVDSEAELAIKLESLATNYKQSAKSYNFLISKRKNQYILDPHPVIKEIILDLRNKQSPEKIAYRFHFTVAQMIKKTCLILCKMTNINRVILSGGVFQNQLLLTLSQEQLSKSGLQVFSHKNLPCNDSTVSLGQAIIASFRS
jgi:hydrogenase maturation protein HypF